MSRYLVYSTYVWSLGHCSEVIDTQSKRRILVGGVDHQAKAERRAAQLNAEASAREDQESGARSAAETCCPGEPPEGSAQS